MPHWPCLGPTQHDREEESQESESREDPHADGITAWILSAPMSGIIGHADHQIQCKESNLLDEGHQRIGSAQALFLNDVDFYNWKNFAKVKGLYESDKTTIATQSQRGAD